jgi:GNAT superfamily N-acetyltransferase
MSHEPEADRSPPARVRLGRLQEVQVDALAEVHAESAAALWGEGVSADEAPARGVRDFVRVTRDHEVWVAEADYQVAGGAIVRDAAPGVLVVEDLFVSPAFRRFGIGSRLLGRAEERAKELGLPALVLKASLRSKAAAGFCAKHGFHPASAATHPRVAAWLAGSEHPITEEGAWLWREVVTSDDD